jgi:hypothetical protein
MADEVVVEPTRACDVCGGVDDHPRHVANVAADHPRSVPSDEIVNKAIENGAPAVAIRALLDPTTTMAHHDCCKAAGCPDGVCDKVLAEVGDDKLKGDKLRAALKSGKVDHLTVATYTTEA